LITLEKEDVGWGKDKYKTDNSRPTPLLKKVFICLKDVVKDYSLKM
jgi:hypothetical protein